MKVLYCSNDNETTKLKSYLFKKNSKSMHDYKKSHSNNVNITISFPIISKKNNLRVLNQDMIPIS